MQLVASHPNYLVDMGLTHLIIDEVHERSVECDVTVYLAKQLLLPHRIKLVLMSATANASLYQTYFQAPPAIFVGARRFPVETFYVEDLQFVPELKGIPLPFLSIEALQVDFAKYGGEPSPRIFKSQASLVQVLARCVISDVQGYPCLRVRHPSHFGAL